MELDVYKAVEVVGKLEHGSSQPLVMRVINSKGEYEKDHVVKIFKVRNIEQYQPTNKEFYGYALANEFCLLSPKAALIEVSNKIIAQVKEIEAYKDFDLQAGYYYGCEYLQNSVPYEVTDLEKFVNYELETIFAFDALLRNIDRRTFRPNILVYEEELYLIDHELTLNTPSDRECTYYFKLSEWDFFIKEDVGKKGEHIFYSHLKEKNKTEKIQFDTFRELLKVLDVSVLKKVAYQLEEKELNIEDLDGIIQYLNCIKKNENQFINLLKQLLA